MNFFTMILLYALAALLIATGHVAAKVSLVVASPGSYPSGQDYLQDGEIVAEKRVPFDLFFPNKGEAPSWELSVRLEVSTPPDSLIPNAQVLNTVYDFGLPGGQNLTEAVAINSAYLSPATFCVTILETLLPTNEAKGYDAKKEKNASDSSCLGPLRKDCLRVIDRLARETTPAGNGCRLSNFQLSNIKQCEWVFGDNTRASTFNLLEPGLDLTGGFAHVTSEPYDGSNSTLVETAEKRIHMVAIESGSTFTPLCVRVKGGKK